MYRNTYVEVNLKNIEENVRKLISKYNNYKYYFGVVKADCYGHNDIKTVQAIIRGGCNYLAVATLEEALEISTTSVIFFVSIKSTTSEINFPIFAPDRKSVV